jgi:phage shock protein C
MIAGVAGGVAEMIGADPSIVRILWAVLVVLTGGIALLVYVIMAFVVPEAPYGFVRAPGSSPGMAAAGTPPGPPQPSAGGWVAPDGSTIPSTAPPTAHPSAYPGGWVAPDGSVVPMGSGSSPEEVEAVRARRAQRDRSGGLIAGVILMLIGGFFLIRQFIPAIDPGLWWPVAAIIAGVLLIVFAVLPSSRRRD